MPQYQIHLQQLDSIPLAVIRRQAQKLELPRLVPECCGLVWTALREQETKGGRHVAIYWDGVMNVEVGAELQGPFTERGEVVRSATPAGLIAWATHFGPYTQLGAAHDAVRQWCKAHDHELAGPSWEIYGHWQDEWDRDPSKVRTDVFWLLVAS
jgi:effector-binding domain-containing protein